MARLAAAAPHPLADRYTRPGGPWDDRTLDDLLRSAPACNTLFTDDHDTTTWSSSEIEHRVDLVAGGLASLGVVRGDVVAWTAPPETASAVVYRACWRLGAVAAPLHHRMADRERADLLARLDPAVVIEGPDLPTGPPDQRSGSAAPDDVAAVLFTSGSSGRPKGVLHTHRSLAYKARSMVEVHGLTTADAVLMPAPLAHISGLLNGVLVPGVVPMRSVLMRRWDADRALELIEAHRITFMVGPPTFFLGLLDAPSFSPERVRSLRLVSCGGAGVTPAFVADASARLGCVVKRTYGSTEAPTVATSRVDDDPERRATSDGRSTGEAELRVTDPDTGREQPPGTAGELWVRGPEVFCGYLDQADGDDGDGDDHLVDGWFRTGDLAMLDDQGWLTITGRLKDVIIRGGENIATAEVEQVLEAHPDVVQAVAVGQPDERLGERVVAVVVASAPFDLEACRAWFTAQGVARYKTPEQVAVVDALPLLASGKPDRAALRAGLGG